MAWVVAALAAVGCASSKNAARGVEVERQTAPPPSSGGKAANVPPAELQISPRAKMHFEEGLKKLAAARKGGDYAAAERAFREAAAADPNFGEPDYNLGVIAERQGKKEEAVQHYKRAVEKKPSLTQAYVNLAAIALNGGDEAGAIRLLEEVQQKYPEDGASRGLLAEIHKRRGDCIPALEMAKEALYREPKNLSAYKVMMACHLEQRQLAMAKLVGLRALKIDENDPELYYTMGQVLLAEKEPAKAQAQFKLAIEKRPDYVPAHLELAKMALQQEDYQGAEESIRRILQSNGKNAEALVDLGIAYKGMGQYDKALAAYDDAQKINPNLPELYLNRGIVIALKGDPTKAIEYYRQYVQLGGRNEVLAHDLIGEAEAELARREEQRRAEEEAKRLEEEMKRQQAAAEAEAKKVKEAELQKQIEQAKGKDSADDELKKCLEKAKNAKQRKKCEKTVAKAAPQTSEAPPEPAPEPPPAPAPTPPASSSSGEPVDNL